MRLAPIVAFVHMAVCGYIRVDIKSFTMEVVTNPAWHRHSAESGETSGSSGTSAPRIQFREEQYPFVETTTVEQPSDNCRFRFPEQKHINGIMSDMMNQLVRMYVKMEAFISRQVPKESRKLRRADDWGEPATRYKLVQDRRKSFFDELFNNMTTEYSKSFNMSASQPGAGCPSQRSVRQRWRFLLRQASARLESAVRASAARQLAARGAGPRSRAARALRRHVAHELRQVGPRQLRAMCDAFQLCYQEQFLQSDIEL